MTTKQRVFSQNNTIYYDDYLKIKQGTECLKTINADSNPTINKFVNYEQFLYLSKAFYKQVNAHECKNEYVTNLYNANISYIEKPSIHLCNPAILYPYGQYKHRQSDQFYFPYKLDMKQMCRKNERCYDDILHAPCVLHVPYENERCYDDILHTTYENDKLPISNHDNNCKSNNAKKCKTGLCKNAKQLFI